MLGASGAIAGVLGAYMAIYPHHKVKTLLPIFGFFTVIEVSAFYILFFWFFTQIFAGSASIMADTSSFGGVAFFAHIGGFIAGWILAKLLQLLKFI